MVKICSDFYQKFAPWAKNRETYTKFLAVKRHILITSASSIYHSVHFIQHYNYILFNYFSFECVVVSAQPIMDKNTYLSQCHRYGTIPVKVWCRNTYRHKQNTDYTVLCAEQSVQAAAKFTTKRRIRGKRETALCRFEKEHEIYHIVNSFENIFGFSSKRFKQP